MIKAKVKKAKEIAQTRKKTRMPASFSSKTYTLAIPALGAPAPKTKRARGLIRPKGTNNKTRLDLIRPKDTNNKTRLDLIRPKGTNNKTHPDL